MSKQLLEIASRLASFGTAQISDALDRGHATGGFTVYGRSLDKGLRGIARTVQVPPGGNRALHQCLASIEPGDVMVVDAGGQLDRAIAGELIVQMLLSRGAFGLIVHGAIRDADALCDLGFPVMARGTSPLGPHKEPGGRHGKPVSIGSMHLTDGDLVVGDADGIVGVPVAQADAVLEGANRVAEREAIWRDDIIAGRGWPDVLN